MDRSLPGGTSSASHRKWQQIILDPSHERYTPRQRPGTAAVRLLRKRHARKHNIHGLHVADDTKVYRNIKTHIDREVLQSDLSRLENWSRKWQLRFNADKSKLLHIGRDNEHYMSTTWTETLR